MAYIFITAISLLAFSFLFRVTEEVYGARVARGMRNAINTRFVRVQSAVGDFFHNGYEYTHREFLTRVLHMLAYGTLCVVRKVERVLENAMVWLRSLRRKSRARRMERSRRRSAQE
jgi:hypothetical protein